MSTFISIAINSCFVFIGLAVVSGALVILGKIISDESLEEHTENSI